MDPAHFSSSEILEMAIRIEENGLIFYKVAADATNSEELEKLFGFLSKEEKKHIEYFSGLAELITGDETYNTFDPYIAEESLYLEALADSSVFTETDWGSKLANECTGELEVLSKAIEVEKDSILFYYELKNMVREKDQDLLEKIIAEERDHLAKLTELKQKLKG